MKYTIVTTRQYRKAFKKIKYNTKLLADLRVILKILANDLKIPRKYKDHQLVGRLKDYRELHIRSDILLVYQKHDNILVLLLANIGSHSELF